MRCAGDKKLWLSTLKRISKNGAQVGNFNDDEADTQNPLQVRARPFALCTSRQTTLITLP